MVNDAPTLAACPHQLELDASGLNTLRIWNALHQCDQLRKCDRALTVLLLSARSRPRQSTRPVVYFLQRAVTPDS